MAAEAPVDAAPPAAKRPTLPALPAINTHGQSVFTHCPYTQRLLLLNHEGFSEMVTSVYVLLSTIDGRLSRRYSFQEFYHMCCFFVNIREIYITVKRRGTTVYWETQISQFYESFKGLIPEPIYLYLEQIGRVMLDSGEIVYPDSLPPTNHGRFDGLDDPAAAAFAADQHRITVGFLRSRLCPRITFGFIADQVEAVHPAQPVIGQSAARGWQHFAAAMIIPPAPQLPWILGSQYQPRMENTRRQALQGLPIIWNVANPFLDWLARLAFSPYMAEAFEAAMISIQDRYIMHAGLPPNIEGSRSMTICLEVSLPFLR